MPEAGGLISEPIVEAVTMVALGKERISFIKMCRSDVIRVKDGYKEDVSGEM